MWKCHYLSKGRKLTLVKSTLSSLPIYHMSLFVIPQKVSLKLEKIHRNFLCKEGKLQSRPHLVNWSIIVYMKKKKKVGLGIRNLSTLNLLRKWCWIFTSENEFL